MKKFTGSLLLLLFLLPSLSWGKPPVEDDILLKTLDSNSPYFYTSLMIRYKAGDKTLTDEDYHYLYYGYAYQDTYKPLETNPDLDKFLMLASALDPESPDEESLHNIILFGEKTMMRDPFNPKVLNMMAFAYEKLGELATAEGYSRHMNGIIRAIISSGDGLTQKTPRHILMFDHAQDVMAVEGFQGEKARVISRTVEFIPLTTPYFVEGKKRRGFYYDFNRIYRNKPEGYTYQRDRTWQFNNLKPRKYK